jgi:hypothetical protein
MNENTIEIDKNEYKSILELAYKAAMLKEAVLNTATLAYFSNGLCFGCDTEVATIIKYAFPDEYEKKLRELQEEKAKEDGEQ